MVSGGNGRFATVLKRIVNSKNYYFPSKSQMNILNLNSLEKYLKLKKPKYFLHAAALSRPMTIHDKEISKSININIIGTSNVVKVCEKLKIKRFIFQLAMCTLELKGIIMKMILLNP